MNSLTENQIQFWKNNRFLLIKDYFSLETQTKLRQWTEELESWPEASGKWMKYFESNPTDSHKKVLCRIENFLTYHDAYRAFLTDENLMGILKNLMAEEAILFKEKINFKMPGGGEFKPHQDAPAFAVFGQQYHVTMMIAIDSCTQENGCLEVIEGYQSTDLLTQAEDGTIAPSVSDGLQWKPVQMSPRDVLFFDSYLPHRSQMNRTLFPRRALYITYNRKSDGDLRNQYFIEKRKAFPPEIERTHENSYTGARNPFNLGNPIR